MGDNGVALGGAVLSVVLLAGATAFVSQTIEHESKHGTGILTGEAQEAALAGRFMSVGGGAVTLVDVLTAPKGKNFKEIDGAWFFRLSKKMAHAIQMAPPGSAVTVNLPTFMVDGGRKEAGIDIVSPVQRFEAAQPEQR